MKKEGIREGGRKERRKEGRAPFLVFLVFPHVPPFSAVHPLLAAPLVTPQQRSVFWKSQRVTDEHSAA